MNVLTPGIPQGGRNPQRAASARLSGTTSSSPSRRAKRTRPCPPQPPTSWGPGRLPHRGARPRPWRRTRARGFGGPPGCRPPLALEASAGTPEKVRSFWQQPLPPGEEDETVPASTADLMGPRALASPWRSTKTMEAHASPRFRWATRVPTPPSRWRRARGRPRRSVRSGSGPLGRGQRRAAPDSRASRPHGARRGDEPAARGGSGVPNRPSGRLRSEARCGFAPPGAGLPFHLERVLVTWIVCCRRAAAKSASFQETSGGQ